MVEHSAFPFAFFFLGEYASILIMSVLTSIFFFGGYLIPFGISSSPFLQSFVLGLKSSLVFFFFIWVRATLPRVRFDQLMVLCWCSLLPLGFAFFVLIICTLVAFEATSY
jgi:NADH-ubiquinone oxidoreductase chain 1